MRKLPTALLFTALLSVITHAAPPAPPYAPLLVYQGNWKITRKSAGPNTKPDQLQNQCAPLGKFFTCQQTVNGSVVALLIFISTDQPGRFITQTVLPEGRAAGKGELQISGNRWVFGNSWNQGSKTTRYQTVNIIEDKNHIHFEQQESSDGVHWETKDSGDDFRIPK
ncbi:MAG: hypothetical protein JO185_03080 [Acidobacteriaceae bacterium]|nr:hypothetical protein [Acidobacteriaceae bacterium]